MDKVIIDRIDVSECSMKCENGDCALYYAELNNDNNELIYGFNCSDNENCYYKQLKRLQAEYDDLHLTYAGCKTANTGLQELNEKLQAENERLKNDLNEAYEHYNFKRIHNEVINAENFKYKQALQEIREIANIIYNTNCNYIAESHKIIDKINEVIGAEE